MAGAAGVARPVRSGRAVALEPLTQVERDLLSEAFEVLRGWARSHNLRLHAVCADVVATLQLPPPILEGRTGASRDG